MVPMTSIAIRENLSIDIVGLLKMM